MANRPFMNMNSSIYAWRDLIAKPLVDGWFDDKDYMNYLQRHIDATFWARAMKGNAKAAKA